MTFCQALLGAPSFAVLVAREKMRMVERRWAGEIARNVKPGDVVTLGGVEYHVR